MAHLPPPLSELLFIPPSFSRFLLPLAAAAEGGGGGSGFGTARAISSFLLPPPACRVRDGPRVKERTKGLYCLCWCHPRPRGGYGEGGVRMQFFLFSSSACLYNSDTTGGGFGGFARREDITSRSLWFPFLSPSSSSTVHCGILLRRRAEISTQRDGTGEIRRKRLARGQ